MPVGRPWLFMAHQASSVQGCVEALGQHLDIIVGGELGRGEHDQVLDGRIVGLEAADRHAGEHAGLGQHLDHRRSRDRPAGWSSR